MCARDHGWESGPARAGVGVSLRRNGWSNVAGTLARLSVGLITTPILIRVLGLERYGLWVVLMAIFAICSLSEFGYGTAVTVFLAAARSENDDDAVAQILGTSLRLMTGVGIVVSLGWIVGAGSLAPRLIPHALHVEDIVVASSVLASGLVPRLWQSWLGSIEAGLARYDLQAKAETLSSIVSNVGVVVLAWMTHNFIVMVSWYVAAIVCAVVMHWWLLRGAGHFLSRPLWESSTALQLTRFSLQHWVFNVSGIFYERVDRLVISSALGLQAVALYAAALTAVVRVNELSALSVQPIMPAMSAALARRDGSALRALYMRSTRLNSLIVYVLAVSLMWGAPWISRILSPHRPHDLGALISALALVYGLFSLSGASHYTMLGYKRPGVMALAAVVGTVASLIPMWFLAHHFGLLPAAWANLGYCVILAGNVWSARLVQAAVKELVSIFAIVLGGLIASFGVSHLVFAGHSVGPEAVGAWLVALTLSVWIDLQSVLEAWALLRRLIALVFVRPRSGAGRAL